MKKLLIYLILISGVFIYSLSAADASGSNLVKNGSFEEGSLPIQWGTWTWKPSAAAFKIVDGISYTGDRSACITNSEDNDGRYTQTINVEEDSQYCFSAWIRTDGIGNEQKGANISIEGRLETAGDIRGDVNEWNYVEMYIHTGSDVDSVIITLGLGGYGSINSGTAYFDEVSFIKVDSIPQDASVAYVEKPEKKRTDNKSDAPVVHNTGRPFWLMVLAAVSLIAIYIHYRLTTAK